MLCIASDKTSEVEMKLIKTDDMRLTETIAFLVVFLAVNTSMAQVYSCSNVNANVQVQITLISHTIAEVEVRGPFQKQMKCDVDDFTNGTDLVKGFACDNGEELPDVLAINEKSMVGFIEVLDQPHYDLICK